MSSRAGASRTSAGEFDGKVVLVTGGARGVGRAIVREFASLGAHVVVNYFHSEQAAREVREETAAAGGSCEVFRASVAKDDDVTTMFDAVRKRHGRLDVLVNNAARGVLAPTTTLTELDWRKIFDVNVHGARRCAFSALPLLSEAGGAVVNVSSIGAWTVMANYTAVGVSKAALEALSRYLAVEFAPRNVRVNVASAGPLDNTTADLFPGASGLRENCAVSTPMGRLGTEEELARLVVALASPGLSWVTGQKLMADGGLSLGHALLRPTPSPEAPVRGASGGHQHDSRASGTGARSMGVESAAPPVRTADRGRPAAAVRSTTPARTTTPPTPGTTDVDGARTVAVVGMGLALPGAVDPAEFWELLRRGEPVFDEPRARFRREAFWAPGADVPDHGYTFRGGYIREPRLHREAKAPSCAQDVAAQWLRHSVAQAYEDVARLPDDRVECFVANTVEGNQHLDERLVVETALRRITRHWPEAGTDRDELAVALRALLLRHYPFAAGDGRDHLPDGVARAAITDLLPAGSPYTTVDTACSSSLYAIDLGTKSLLAGECDIAVCGGVFTNSPRFSIMFAALRGLSRSGAVRTFDQDADGTLFSDGAGVVVLKTLDRARQDGDEVLAVLGGMGVASDGRGKAVYAPNPVGQAIAVRRARQINGTGAEDVDWVVAHGTGTPVGDRVELGTVEAFAPTHGYPCTSNKSLIGHTGWTAGVASVIHAVLGLHHDLIPAQRPLTELTRDVRGTRVRIPLTDLPLPRREDRSRVVGVSAFGFGGTDAHLLVQDEPGPGCPPPRSAPEPEIGDVVLVGWSAHLPGDPSSEEVLTRLAAGKPLTAERAFPTPPPPPPPSVKLAPRTIQTIDRCQVMALTVATRFAEEHGALWKGFEERTGVLAAHTGPASSANLSALRCYADDLRRLRPDDDDGLSPEALAQAVQDCLEQVCEERLPTNEDTLPGLGPNIIPARLANSLDLHGPALTLDTGRSSTHTAMRTACLYLADGEVDLMLVLAMNGNRTTELADVLGLAPDRLAEGAFLFALAREGDAVERGWPVLSRVTIDPRPDRSSESERPERKHTYLAADGAVDLLSALAGGSAESVTVTGPFPSPAVTLHPVDPPHARDDERTRPPREPAEEGPVAGTRGASVVPEPPRDPLTTRYVTRWEPQPLSRVAGGRTTLPVGCLVLADEVTARDIAGAAEEADATVVVVRSGDDPEAVLRGAFPSGLAGGRSYRHLRVVARQREPGPESSDSADTLVALQEAMFLATQRCLRGLDDGGSLGVLLLDPMEDGVPGAHTGLLTGFVKSMSWELPACTCRALVTDEPAEDAWRALELELEYRGGLPVTVRRSGTRYRQRLRAAPPDTAGLPLAPGDVVVATGGARGITAASLEALVEHVPLKVWLLGSSSLADVPDELLVAPEDELPRHRAEYIARSRKREDTPVAELNRRFERLLRARESRLTLDRMRRRCGADAVRYLTCDVLDPDAVHRAAETVLARDGRVDLLVNGAGVHGPGDLARKKLAGFRYVRDVKLRGYQHLKDAFSAPPPRLWCNFGSLTGVIGLPGEAEYSSANDYLDCAAEYQRTVCGQDEYTVAWTVWDEVGLGGGPVAQSLVGRSQRLSSMPKAEGAAHFVAELAQRGRRDAVVTFIGDRERESIPRQFPGSIADRSVEEPDGRILGVPEECTADRATWRLVADERHHQLLRDHLVDGKPTFPGTMLAAMAVEAAKTLMPDQTIRALRDVSFSSWVRVVADRRTEYRVTAEVNGSATSRPTVLVRITSDVTTPRGKVLRRDREHFRATALAGTPPAQRLTPPATDGYRSVRSPYYRTDSRVSLSGGFRTTQDWLTGPFGASATWRPDLTQLPDGLARLPAPALLLDGLARTLALRPVAEGVQEVTAPRHVLRVEWFTDDDDANLVERYPEGIRLAWDAVTGVLAAVAPDGTVLARMQDMRGASMGRIRVDEENLVTGI